MIEHLTAEVGDGVQTIRFDRIEAQNALTHAMCEAAADAISFGESSSRVRAIVLTGTPGIFTVGIDRRELAAFAERAAIGEGVVRLMKTLATADKTVIAAVDGPVFGIGATMLMLCDYVVASEWASFSAPFAAMGLPPDAASSLLAPRILGYQRAFAFLVAGEQFDAARAHEAGLVSRVVPPEEVERAARQVARQIADKPPEAVRLARRLLHGDRREVLARIDQECAAFSELLKSTAARDALQAYIEDGR